MLSLQDVKVKFSYKQILNGVSLDFERAKIYAVMGENGAGKTTLARVMCGDIQPTEGKILLDGKEVSFKSPRIGISHGICCVHQRPLLADSVTIRDNLVLGNNNIDIVRMYKLVKQYLPNRNIFTLVKDLRPAERLYVALMGALLKNPSVLILDEPAVFLSLAEREFLISKIKKSVKQGMTVIIISHYIGDALKTSDHVILLKQGKVVLDEPTENVTEAIVKKELFSVETVDGFEENWPSDLKVEFIDKSVDEKTITRNLVPGKKIGIIPSDRTFRGSNPNLTILQMLTALHTELSEAKMREYAQCLLEKANVNIKITEKASNLSGGMLQRLILQREIAEQPDILYLFEPRQGLDISAIDYLFDTIRSLVQKGVKIIVQEAAS